jgi:hypothetical protein
MLESVEALRNSTDRGGRIPIPIQSFRYRTSGCSRRLQIMLESVEALRNSTDRDDIYFQSSFFTIVLRAVVGDYRSCWNP